MKKIKILEMIDKSFLGGGQINLLSLAQSLDPERFAVSVSTEERGPLVDALRQNNIPHFPLSFPKRFCKKTLDDTVTLLKMHRFDILHTHGGIAGFYGRLASRLCGLPLVVVHTLHGIHYLHYRNVVLKKLYILQEKYLSRHTDAVIFVSDADREKGKQLGLAPEEKQVLIKNGIDFSSFELEALSEPKKKRDQPEISRPLVGTVARLHRQKGIPDLLKAADRMRDVFPEIKVWVVGGGPLKSKMERFRESLGVTPSVCFLGEREDVPQLLSCFDVFILPSLWEGLPYSLLEAAALGKPVVATDIDGVRELIKHEQTGLLVPPGNPCLLADAVIRLLDNRDYALQLGQSLKTEIRDKYTLEQMVYRVQDLYLKLLSCRKKA